MASSHTHSGISRRRFLRAVGAAGAFVALDTTKAGGARGAERAGGPPAFCPLPRAAGAQLIDSTVVLEQDLEVPGLVIAPGGNLIFHPDRNVTLKSTGNVIVEGRLTMRPTGFGQV